MATQKTTKKPTVKKLKKLDTIDVVNVLVGASIDLSQLARARIRGDRKGISANLKQISNKLEKLRGQI